MNKINIPITLTLVRLGVSIFIIPFLIFFILPYNSFWLSKFLVFIFALVSLTDFLDGYIARKYHQETVIGQILDPLADKCFVVASFVTLVALQRLSLFFSLIIIMREFIVTGVRTLSLQHGFLLPSSRIGKWKAVLQYSYLLFVVGTPWGFTSFFGASIETVLLLLTVTLSMISGIKYCHYFIRWLCGVKIQ